VPSIIQYSAVGGGRREYVDKILGALVLAPAITTFPDGTSIAAGVLSAGDGTAALPVYTFASEPTLGFWRSSAGNLSLAAGSLLLDSGKSFSIGSTWILDGGAGNGLMRWRDATGAVGVTMKFDALPSIASGFGTSPSITAGSTALAGSINVGTGGSATTGAIDFNGTTFPSAPFVVVSTKLTNAVTRVSAVSATQMTFTSTTAWTASDIISWICVSPK
jgi:hypothetical protein